LPPSFAAGMGKGSALVRAFTREPVAPVGGSASSVLSPMAWSPRRGRVDNEVGASALAEGTASQLPLTPASLSRASAE
jgi:hypothetical protein